MESWLVLRTASVKLRVVTLESYVANYSVLIILLEISVFITFLICLLGNCFWGYYYYNKQLWSLYIFIKKRHKSHYRRNLYVTHVCQFGQCIFCLDPSSGRVTIIQQVERASWSFTAQREGNCPKLVFSTSREKWWKRKWGLEKMHIRKGFWVLGWAICPRHATETFLWLHFLIDNISIWQRLSFIRWKQNCEQKVLVVNFGQLEECSYSLSFWSSPALRDFYVKVYRVIFFVFIIQLRLIDISV